MKEIVKKSAVMR